MNPFQTQINRRQMLGRFANGFGMLGLAGLFGSEAFGITASSSSPLTVKEPHFPAKAKRVIFLFMSGGPSHVDTFDPKPELAKYDGQPYLGKQKFGSNNRPVGYLMKSPFRFDRHIPH